MNSQRSEGSFPHMATETYVAVQLPRVTRALARSQVVVACNPEEPGQIFGWICFERSGLGTVIHYVYTKHVFRRMGVATALFSAANPSGGPVTVTSTGRLFEDLRAKYSLTYDPTLA